MYRKHFFDLEGQNYWILMHFLEAPAAKMNQKGASETASEGGSGGVFLVRNRKILSNKCTFPWKRNRFVFQNGKSSSKVMLSQKTMMALRPKGPMVARSTILTKHQGQQQEHHLPRGGQPGPRAQPHALFFREGGSRRKLKCIRCLQVQKCA